MSKTALILGVNGQDGSFMADRLVALGYKVHGLVRRTSVDNLWRIRQHLPEKSPPTVTLHHGDLLDPQSVWRALEESKADEVYNFADQDHVDWSFKAPRYTWQVTYGAVADLLEMLRERKPSPALFQPSSSTIYGAVAPPQDEDTPHAPASPYAVAKLAVLHLCRHYRREYGLHVACGIFFNHDSERRQGEYLLHKLAKGMLAVLRRSALWLPFRDLKGVVDIGYAPEYVAAAHAMLQAPVGNDDLVIGTGKRWPLGHLISRALWIANSIQGPWVKLERTPEDLIGGPDSFKRPGTPPRLVADPKRANIVLDWYPKHDAGDVLVRLFKFYLGGIPEAREPRYGLRLLGELDKADRDWRERQPS